MLITQYTMSFLTYLWSVCLTSQFYFPWKYSLPLLKKNKTINAGILFNDIIIDRIAIN